MTVETAHDVGGIVLTTDERVSAAIASGCVVSFSLSGGKDSQIAAHSANRLLDWFGHPRERRFAVHADLGRAEWRSTTGEVRRQAAELGLDLSIVRRAKGDMVSMFEQRYDDGLVLYRDLLQINMRGPWSSSEQRFCTAGQKRDVINQHLASRFPGETIVSTVGIRRAESLKRRAAPVSKIDAKLVRACGTNGMVWNPLVAVQTPEVYDYARRHGLTLHEAYEIWNASRLSCAFCVIASAGDLAISSTVPSNADVYRELVAIEARTGFSFQQGGWLADVAPALFDGTLASAIADAKAYALERRASETLVGRDFLAGSSADPWPRRLPTPAEAQAIAAARRINGLWIGEPFAYASAGDVTDRIATIRASNETKRRNSAA